MTRKQNLKPRAAPQAGAPGPQIAPAMPAAATTVLLVALIATSSAFLLSPAMA